MAINLFLVGPMGAGKTTIGKLLAKKLHLEFYDSDREIEAQTGASISLIFDIEGESGFRKRESDMIDVLSAKNDVVLATGGGAVLDPGTRQKLSARGVVIYLKASIEKQFERTLKDKNRPLLQTNNPKDKLIEIMDAREPLYIDLSDIIINTDNKSIPRLINDITDELRQTKLI